MEKRMKRSAIDINDIVDYGNLSRAAFQAAAGKRLKPEVWRFMKDFHGNIRNLRAAILDGRSPFNRYKTFTIFDPKQRDITAVCFEDRILHHALMNLAGPVLDRVLIPFTFACRTEKGPLKAVHHAQQCARKYPWYVKIDIKKYFETIDHAVLLTILEGKIKGKRAIELLRKIVTGFSTTPGRGLPIGSLTSQHFANFYLNSLDRFVLETLPVLGYARYMDDILWWCRDNRTAKNVLQRVVVYAREQRGLTVKDAIQINRSERGVTFCGFRIFPQRISLTRRRMRRYSQRRQFWERAYSRGLVSSTSLQRAYASVKGIVVHADCREWMKKQIQSYPEIYV
jgi:RNA-directed DNA polymerase